MTNPFKNRALPLSGPATDMIPVVASDSTDLPVMAVAIYAETGGSVHFVSARGEMRSVVVADFSILPVGVVRVLETGTTATGLHAMVIA